MIKYLSHRKIFRCYKIALSLFKSHILSAVMRDTGYKDLES